MKTLRNVLYLLGGTTLLTGLVLLVFFTDRWFPFVMIMVGGAILFTSWGTFRDIVERQEFEALAQKQQKYEGHVTSIVQSGNHSQIFLNSNHQSVTVNGRTQLKIGEYYQLVVDGNDKLIDATIVAEK
jgi:membrane protein implicated in regulation of membrane protease activity